MKTCLILTAVILLAVVTLQAQSVVGSKHDLSSGSTGVTTSTTEVCVFCHTPHQPVGTTTAPLWNHTLSTTASYGVYSSNTLDASPIDLGGGSTISNLCLSCHDGTVSVASLYNAPGSGSVDPTITTAGGGVGLDGLLDAGHSHVGTDLTNDHPVNFAYDTALATADGGLHDPATSSAVADLLDGGTVQCSSCHDPHDDSHRPFLVMSNGASALCTTCHIK